MNYDTFMEVTTQLGRFKIKDAYLVVDNIFNGIDKSYGDTIEYFFQLNNVIEKITEPNLLSVKWG